MRKLLLVTAYLMTLGPAPALADESIPGFLLTSDYMQWPETVTVNDERRISGDLLALCAEAKAAVIPLSPDEVKWLDEVAPKTNGLGRGIKPGSDASKPLKIWSSSAYVRESLISNLDLCLRVIGNLFPQGAPLEKSFPARWSAVTYTAFALRLQEDNFRLAAQNGWMIAAPAWGQETYDFGFVFKLVTDALIPNITMHVAANY